MSELLIISLPKKLALTEHISKTKQRISKWTKSPDESFNEKMDAVQLKKCERSEKEYLYHYVIARGANSDRKR